MKRFLFFSSFFVCLTIFTINAFADEPLASVNGGSPVSLTSAIAESSVGDTVRVVSGGQLSAPLTFPSGVTVVVPYGVSIASSSRFAVSGDLVNYGSLIYNGTVNNSGGFVTVGNGNFSNYGKVLASDYGRAVVAYNSSSSGLAFFGGSEVHGNTYAVQWPADIDNLTIRSGIFVSNTRFPVTPEGALLNLPNGVSYDVEGNSINVSWGPLRYVTQFVTEAIAWIGLLIGAVVTNKLLLCFFLFVFVGLGVGLIRRLI